MQTSQKRLDMLKISQRTSALIQEHNLTQKYVAISIGLSEQIFSNKLTGIRPFAMKDIVALADFFEVSADYLLGRIDTPWPDPWEKNGKEAE